jgi:hypothetical protein
LQEEHAMPDIDVRRCESPLRKVCRYLPWLVPLLLTAGDACAWGLYTHVYFAQALLWLAPLADPRARAAMRRLPRLVLAGASLPDLALTDIGAEKPVFDTSHDWDTAARLLANAASDEEKALSLGFACHTFTDIFAHNHFVPAHELVWFDASALTHVACEWAMDHNVRANLYATPAELLESERSVLAAYAAKAFHCTEAHASASLATLGNGDGLLRKSGLPALVWHAGRVGDRRMQRRFAHYLSHTTRHLHQMDRLLAGERPRWVANPCRHAARAALAEVPARLLRERLPMPADVFA